MKIGLILACALGQVTASWLWAQAATPPAKAVIDGQVVNAETGEPVKKARLMLMAAQARGNTMPYGATSDAAGHFTIREIDPGKYRLMAERTGFVRGDYGARGPNRAGAMLSLDAGQAMKDVVIRLTPQAVITGRVVDEDGDPVADVNVSVMRFAYVRGKRQIMPAGGKPTNDLGEYRIHGLEPGRYFLCATYRPMGMMTGSRMSATVSMSGPGQAKEESYAPTYYPNTTDAASAAPLDVGPGTQLRGIDLVLAKSRTVHVGGRIVNLAGEHTRRGVMVNLVPRDTGSAAMFNRASTSVRDPSGNFELKGVTPGAYVLTATLMDGNRRYTAKMPLDVGNGNVEGLSLNLSPGATLSGRVRLDGEGNLDLHSLRVTLQPREEGSGASPGGSASVKSDGSFALDNLGPDRFAVGLFGLPDTFYVKSVRFGDEDVTESGPDLSRGAAPLDIVVSPAGGQIDGVVKTQKDEPAAAVAVVLIPGGARRELSQFYKLATTDQNGAFSLKGIAPGDYKLFAWDDVESGAYQDPEFLKPFENRGESVSMKEGSHENVQLKLLPARPE